MLISAICSKHKVFFSTLSKQNKGNIEALVLGINFNDRELLYSRINQRVDIMMENGLLKEAQNNLNYTSKNGGFQAIGHKEFFDYFNGETSFDEAVENLKRSTRRYAKRQLTWFNKNTRINWIYKDETENTVEAAMNFIKEE